MRSVEHLGHWITPSRLLAVLAVFLLVLAFMATTKAASAYSYTTPGYYLSEYDGANEAYSYHTVEYGSWYCLGHLCSISISAMLQYVNVWYTSESFSCWYQEVYNFYPINWRGDGRTTNYYTTPSYNWQYTWGMADSFGGNQEQIVTTGDESTECGRYGSAGGLNFVSAIVRNSTSAYTSAYGW